MQTGPAPGGLGVAQVTPFRFHATVEGDNGITATNPITAVTVTPPGGSATALSFDAENHRWLFQDPTPSSMANLNATYTTGSYTFTPTGTPNMPSTVTVGSFASSLLQAPLLTLSGGSWLNGTYVISNASALTVTFNPIYTGSPASDAGFHYDSGISGVSYVNGPTGFVNWDPTTNSAAPYASTPPDFVIGAGQLAAGDYTLEVNYADIQNPQAVYGSAFSASLLEYRTTLSVTVVPEPAANAGALGVVALLGAALVQRRRQSA